MPAAPGQAEDSLRPFPGRPGAVANQRARVDAACPTIPGMAAMPVPCSSTVEPANRTAKCAAAKATSDGLRYCQCCPVRSREMRALFLRALANRPEREFGFVRISNALGRSYQLAAQPSALLVLVLVAPGGLLVRLQLVPITRSREAVYVQPCGDRPAASAEVVESIDPLLQSALRILYPTNGPPRATTGDLHQFGRRANPSCAWRRVVSIPCL